MEVPEGSMADKPGLPTVYAFRHDLLLLVRTVRRGETVELASRCTLPLFVVANARDDGGLHIAADIGEASPLAKQCDADQMPSLPRQPRTSLSTSAARHESGSPIPWSFRLACDKRGLLHVELSCGNRSARPLRRGRCGPSPGCHGPGRSSQQRRSGSAAAKGTS